MEIEIKEKELEIEFGEYNKEGYLKLEIINLPQKWQENWEKLKNIVENVLTLKMCQQDKKSGAEK